MIDTLRSLHILWMKFRRRANMSIAQKLVFFE